MILKRKPQLMGFRQGLAKLMRIRSAFRYLVKRRPPLANKVAGDAGVDPASMSLCWSPIRKLPSGGGSVSIFAPV